MELQGIGIYFFDDRIRIFSKTMEDLKYPKYIHLLIMRKEKLLLIRGCEKRDNDTFKVMKRQDGGEWRYRISSKAFVIYLASLIGVPYPSDSLWLQEAIKKDENTVLINLSNYQVLPYYSEREQ